MIRWLKEFWCGHFHSHRYETVECVPSGYATVDWWMRPVRELRYVEKCVLCDKVHIEHNYIPGDQQWKPECYDSTGWPIDDSGNRLPRRTYGNDA